MGKQVCPWCGETREVCEKSDEGCPTWEEDEEEADLATDCAAG